MQSFLVGVVFSPQTGGEVTNTGYESMPASLDLVRSQIQAFEQSSVVDKPHCKKNFMEIQEYINEDTNWKYYFTENSP
jgi:hypothetical protein